jgi:hypothetical protein
MNVIGSRFNAVFVPLFRGHLVKYNYILIFYNIDTMASFANADDIPVNSNIGENPAAPAGESPADPTAAGETPAAPAGETPAGETPATPEASTPTALTEGASAQVGSADKKTCVEPMDAAPTEDGKYVMFDGGNYKVFTMPADAAMLIGASAGAKFFKVVSGPMAGGKHKKQHKSAKKQHKSAKKQHKSAKKQHKSAKKQHKSAKKQRKSRSSRRYKK